MTKRLRVFHIIQKKYNQLIEYGKNNPRCSRVIDIFKNFLYKHNDWKITISVGKRNEDSFVSFLSSIMENFIVKLDVYKNEPVFIIGNNKQNIACINVAAITNLHIKSNLTNDKYFLSFNYNNEIDYMIDIRANN